MKVNNGASGISEIKVAFPSNSKTKEPQEKTVKKIVEGSVQTRKKTLGKKMTETFLGDDVNNVFSYILYDVVVPAVKSTISDMVSGGVEMLLFGEQRSSPNVRRDGNKSFIDYRGLSSVREQKTASHSRNNRASHNFDDIILGSRGEAEEVLDHLVDLVIDYKMASVADLYDMVGIASSFTDNKYGWTNLSNAKVSRVRNGYLIDLPRPIVID